MTRMRGKSAGSGEQIYLATATIVAGLVPVLQLAQDISLQAMNAKALANRAGEQARVFNPITDLMDQLARESLNLVQAINGEARATSREAQQLMRARMLRGRLNRVADRARESRHVASLGPLIARTDDELAAAEARIRKHLHALLRLTEEIDRSMRAARVVSGTSRIEAVNISGFEDSFRSLSATLDEAAVSIHDRVTACRTQLHSALAAVG